jgi:streptogramin lyase
MCIETDHRPWAVALVAARYHPRIARCTRDSRIQQMPFPSATQDSRQVSSSQVRRVFVRHDAPSERNSAVHQVEPVDQFENRRAHRSKPFDYS